MQEQYGGEYRWRFVFCAIFGNCKNRQHVTGRRNAACLSAHVIETNEGLGAGAWKKAVPPWQHQPQLDGRGNAFTKTGGGYPGHGGQDDG